jgi:hypothetical protein
VSKKKSAKKSRPASPAGRRPVKSGSSRGPVGPKGRPQSKKVQLKPIMVLIERAIADLRRLPAADATDLAIKQLEIAQMAIGDVCNLAAPDGCGPSMEFPSPPAA